MSYIPGCVSSGRIFDSSIITTSDNHQDHSIYSCLLLDLNEYVRFVPESAVSAARGPSGASLRARCAASCTIHPRRWPLALEGIILWTPFAIRTQFVWRLCAPIWRRSADASSMAHVGIAVGIAAHAGASTHVLS